MVLLSRVGYRVPIIRNNRNTRNIRNSLASRKRVKARERLQVGSHGLAMLKQRFWMAAVDFRDRASALSAASFAWFKWSCGAVHTFAPMIGKRYRQNIALLPRNGRYSLGFFRGLDRQKPLETPNSRTLLLRHMALWPVATRRSSSEHRSARRATRSAS